MFGRLKRGWKWYKILGQIEKAWKECMTMDDKPIQKSATNWGGLAAALVPISAAVLGLLGLQELVLPVAEILGGIATILLIIGKRRLDGKRLMNGVK